MTDPDTYTESARILTDRERAELAACPETPYVWVGGRQYHEDELPDAGDLADLP